MGTRDELLEAVAVRYRAATRAEKGRILTEFVEISGYHRKHAERLLRRDHVVDRSRPRPERRIYDDAVRTVQRRVKIWRGDIARSLVFGPDGDAQPQMTSAALRNLEAPRVRGHLQPTEPETAKGEDLREQMPEATE